MRNHRRNQRWLVALIAMPMATDAFAKAGGGEFIVAFVLAGGMVGLVVGAASALLDRVGFWRGAAWVLILSLLPWVSLLLYWDLSLASKSNLQLMIVVLIGSVPVYLVAYGLAYLFT